MMRAKTILILMLCLIQFSSFAAFAFEKCIMCSMDAEKSETKFAVQVREETKDIPAGEYAFCCLHCLLIFQHRIGGGKITSIHVRNYYHKAKMIEAEKGFYLVESKLHPNGSMVPFMRIFSSEKDAEMFKEEFGGRILDWEEVWKYVEGK